MLVRARRAVVLATLFVTSANADCGADMVVEAVMIVDVIAAIARRREDDELSSAPLSMVSSSPLSGAAKRTTSDG